MRHLLSAIFVTMVLVPAGIVDRQWHQYHCLAAVRKNHLISVGSHEFGFAEYSYRGILGPTTTPPDPRDVFVFFGPFGTLKLSKLLLVAGVVGTVGIGYRLLNIRPTERNPQDA